MNVVHLCDCMKFMETCKDKQYDLAITDPPYGIGSWTSDHASYPQKSGKIIKIKKENYKKVTWNDKIPEKKYFDELLRISRNQIIWGANYYNCFYKLGGAFVWYKGKGNPTYSQCEIASLSFQKKVDFCHIDWQSGFSRQQKENVIHPCQKPVALYKWLLTNYAKPGQTIFDSHVGSGSIRIACHDLGFDFEGCELDVDYFNAQEKRYQEHIAQGELFDKKEIQENIFKETDLDLT